MQAAELDELVPQLLHADPEVRSSAAGALGALGRDGVPAIAPLFEACRDENMYVRGEAAHSLWEIAGSCWAHELSEAKLRFVDGLPTLIALLDDPWWSVRCSAMSVLQRIGPQADNALPRLVKFVTDEIVGLTEHPEGWDSELESNLLRESATEAIAVITQDSTD